MVRGLGEWAGIINLPAHHPTCQDHPLLHQAEGSKGGIQISMKAMTHYCSAWLWSWRLWRLRHVFFLERCWIEFPLNTYHDETYFPLPSTTDIASAVNSLKDSQVGWRDHENTLGFKKQIHPYVWLNAQHAHTTSWKYEHTVNAQKEFRFRSSISALHLHCTNLTVNAKPKYINVHISANSFPLQPCFTFLAFEAAF